MAADFVDEAVRAILIVDAGIIATGATVHVNAVPQGQSSPFIIIEQISRVPSETKDGISETDTFRLQIDCWDTSISTARDMAKAVKDAIDAYSGTEGNVEIVNTWLADQVTVRDDVLDLNGISTDYMIIESI